MPKDVIITPASGKLDFYATTGGSVLANINLTDNNDLSLSTTSGNLIIGDASRDVYIGDGTNEVDIVFEQNGEIRSVAGKYVTINAGTINATDVAVNTSSPTAVMHVYGSTPSGTVLNVEGTNGSLFSVVDNLDGTLMSVNNNAGLPVLEVFSDDKIVGGRFGQNDFVVSSSGNVGIGKIPDNNYKLDVNGKLNLYNSTSLSNAQIYVENTDGYLFIDSNAEVNINSTFLYINSNAQTNGSFTATSFVKTDGTSSQFLKADGSTDSTAYTTNTGTVTSVSGTGTVSGLTLTGTVTTSGSLTLGGTLSVTPSDFASQTANTFLAAPSGSAGVPTFRAVVAADIPTLNQNTTGSAATLTTTRTLWGQNFNGSANVSGNIIDAGNITMGTQTNKATLTYTTNTARTYTIPDAGANAEFVLSAGNQNVGGVKTFTSQIINTASNNTNAGAGQIYLNGATGNRIDFNTNGVGVPNLYSRTLGSKINLYPSLLTGSATDFAIGLGNDGAGAPTRFWQSVDTTNSRFEWFAGATSIATLTGSGVLTVAGSTSQINVDNLRLDGSIISTTNTNGSLSINPNGTGSIFLGNAGLIEFRPSSNRFIMSDSGPETICDFNESNCLFRKSSGGGATVALFIDRSSSTATVGINTNTPSEALEVDGTIKAKSLNIGSSNTLNVANTYGSIIGGYQSKASMYGEIAHAAGGFSNVQGTAQHTILVVRGLTLSGAFTVSIASPAVFTKSGHSLSVGDTVTLSTTGSLPTGLNTTTTYYVISSGLTGSTFQLSTTLNGTAINTSGTQSGTHTLVPSTSLTLNGAIGLTTPQLMVIPARSAWAYTIKISAYNSNNNQGAAYHAFGGLRRNLSTTIELETTNGYSYLETSFNTTPALVSINADTVNNALDIRVTGIINQSTRWVAVVDLVQVSYGTP